MFISYNQLSMKAKIAMASCLITMTAGNMAASGTGIRPFIERIDSISRYDASAEYSVLLPSAADEITYNVSLQSKRSDGDLLSPVSYLIEWSLTTPTGISEGVLFI